MNFETLHALRALDERTPEYFRREIWAHGDAQVVLIAAHILRTGLRPEPGSVRSVRVLSEVIKLVPGRDSSQ